MTTPISVPGEMGELARLRVQCAELEEEVRQLRDVLAGGDGPLPSWLPRITRAEERVLRMLLRHSVLTTAFFEASNPQLSDPDGALKVFINRLRKKLGPSGVVITNDYGRGYFLASPTRALLTGEIARRAA